MPKKSFVFPGKAPGGGSYPIPDIAHARNALARVSAHGSPAEKAAVRRKVCAKFPQLPTCKKKESIGQLLRERYEKT